MGRPDEAELVEALRLSGSALRRSGLPFALAGGFAVHAWGGPVSGHDVDFVVRPQDADAALEVLAAAGFRTEHPPEDWLVKAWYDDALVDLIFRPSGVVVDDRLLAGAAMLSVAAIDMPVLLPTDVMILRLLALSEHHCDYSRHFPAARAMRERLDWSRLAVTVSGSPFARGFLHVLHGLGIAPAAANDAVAGGEDPWIATALASRSPS